MSSALTSDDFTEFIQAFRSKDYAEATALYKGGFLAGFPIISEPFEEWRSERAASAESAAIQAYRMLVEQKLAREDNSAIPDLCARALQIARHDPFFIRAQIEALAAQNDVGEALALYASHRRLLISETGALPPWMTEDFAARISGLTHIDLATDRSEVRIPFVGRVQHLKSLRDAWRQSQRECRALRLIGEAGAGKSRLLTQFVRRTALEGARVHLHKCAESESVVPYAAIVGLLLSNYRLEVISALTSHLRDALFSVAPEIGSDGCAGHYHQRVILEAFAQYFTAIAQTQRLVLAVDDFQWSDDVSRTALNYVTRRLEPSGSLVLVAARPDRGEPATDDLWTELPVDRMSSDEVDKIIQHHEALHSLTIDPRDRATIHYRSAGNPFFVLQLLRYLRDSAKGNMSSSAETLLPASVSRVLKSRLARLSDSARQTAAAAAVLSRPASVASVAEVSGLPEIAVANAINELVRSGIVQDGYNFQFVHDLMRLAAYDDMGVALRQVLHHRAAIALERAGVAHGELAFHFELGGSQHEAWSHARTAAEEAARLSAYREADRQFQRMQRCASPHDVIQTEAEYLAFLYHADRAGDAYPYLRAAEQYARDKPNRELDLLCQLVRVEREGLHSLERAHQLVDEAQQRCPDLLHKVIRVISEVVRSQGSVQLLRSLGQMLSMETRGRAGACRQAMAGFITASTDGYEAGLPLVERAVQLAEESHDPVALTLATFSRGTVRYYAGMCTATLADYQRVLQLSDELGAVDLSPATTSNLAVVYMELDRLDMAEECARRVLALATPQRRPFAAGNLALLYYRRRDYQAARNCIEMLESSPTRDMYSWIPLQALALRGLCSVAEKDWQDALRISDELANLAPQDTLPLDLSTVHEFMAQVIAVRESEARAASYLLEKNIAVSTLDYLQGARLALLAARYLVRDQAARSANIATPIFRRASAFGAIAVANEAANVLKSLSLFPNPMPA